MTTSIGRLSRLVDGPPCDLVLTDLEMPRMTGWDVARSDQGVASPCCVALFTGWGEQPDARSEDRGVVDFFLPKPATREAFRLAIAHARPRQAFA